MANLTQDEINQLEVVQTEDEWNAACKTIKKTHGDRYPDDWFAKVLQSGLSNRVLARFGEKPGMYLSSVGDDGKVKDTKFIENNFEK